MPSDDLSFLNLIADKLKAQAAPPAAAPAMPPAGFIPGTLQLNKDLAPTVPAGAARPFAPGEFVRNPDGSWSSEETITVQSPSFNGGKPTVLPTLWLKDGKPYVARDEQEAVQLAQESGLTWQSFPTLDAADKFAVDREAAWQPLKNPADASSFTPLYTPTAREYIEPPPPPPPTSSTGSLESLAPFQLAQVNIGGHTVWTDANSKPLDYYYSVARPAIMGRANSNTPISPYKRALIGQAAKSLLSE